MCNLNAQGGMNWEQLLLLGVGAEFLGRRLFMCVYVRLNGRSLWD